MSSRDNGIGGQKILMVMMVMMLNVMMRTVMLLMVMKGMC